MAASTPEFLRTPDERFDDLPRLLVRSCTTPKTCRASQACACTTSTKDRASSAMCSAPARATHVELPLPADDSRVARSGARVVAPDFFGFGRSDKPVDDAWYTFTRHRDSLQAFVRALDLGNITLACQDWGGILGLTLPMDDPQRFTRLLVMNTALATGTQSLGAGFDAWRAWVNANPDLRVGALMQRACRHLTDDEAAAYDAPFPDQRFKAGARRFPNLVCDHPDADGAEASRAAARWWRDQWQGQAFMAIGMQDTVIPPPAMQRCTVIRNCPPPARGCDGRRRALAGRRHRPGRRRRARAPARLVVELRQCSTT